MLNTIMDNPLMSFRAEGRVLGVNHVTVLKTLVEDRMHLYHL